MGQLEEQKTITTQQNNEMHLWFSNVESGVIRTDKPENTETV